VREWEGRSLLRVSIAPYNDADDVERLLEALRQLTPA
jgi:selenocysteine lyase/cysteine desulfurase